MTESTYSLSEAANAASVVSTCLSLEIMLPWVQALLTPAIILGTAFVAWSVQRNIFANQRIDLAKRTTLEHIHKYELDGEWQKISVVARDNLKSRPNKDDWSDIATRWSKGDLSSEDLELIDPIMLFLNRREFLSICLLNGSMDQSTYADWWGVTMIQEWERATPFVQAIRSTDKGDDDFFSKFQKLAESEKYRRLSNWAEKDSVHK